MRNNLKQMSLVLLLAGLPLVAHAQNNNDASSSDFSNSSTASESSVKTGGLTDEVFGFKPQAGVVNFRDSDGAIQNRGVIGFTLEGNATTAVTNLIGAGKGLRYLYIGPETGVFYSHVGGTGADFLGDAGDTTGSPGANFIFIPADLKIGGELGLFRLSVHGGGNIAYRSVGSAMMMGANPTTTTGSDWNIFPNAGADLEFGMTNKVAFILRPDWTFGGDNRLFAATFGVSIPIG